MTLAVVFKMIYGPNHWTIEREEIDHMVIEVPDDHYNTILDEINKIIDAENIPDLISVQILGYRYVEKAVQ